MGGAQQELGSNQLFEPANLATERGRRHVQPIRGAREAELLGDGDERPQVAQLDPVARSRKWERGLCRFVVTHDWKRERLRVPERKAGHSTAFPLSVSVGEALVDYLRNGRSETDS